MWLLRTFPFLYRNQLSVSLYYRRACTFTFGNKINSRPSGEEGLAIQEFVLFIGLAYCWKIPKTLKMVHKLNFCPFTTWSLNFFVDRMKLMLAVVVDTHEEQTACKTPCGVLMYPIEVLTILKSQDRNTTLLSCMNLEQKWNTGCLIVQAYWHLWHGL